MASPSSSQPFSPDASSSYAPPASRGNDSSEYDGQGFLCASGLSDFDAFFGLEGVNGFEFAPGFGQVDTYMDPFDFGQQFGTPFGESSGSNDLGPSFLAHFDSPSFGFSDFAAFTSNQGSSFARHTSDAQTGFSLSTGDNTASSHRMQQQNGDVYNVIQSVRFPTPNPLLHQHTPPDSTFPSSSANGRSVELPIPSGSAAPSDSSESRAGSNQSRHARNRKTRVPYLRASHSKRPKDRITKGKDKAERDVWRVVTAPVPPITADVPQNVPSGPSANSLSPSEPSASNGSGITDGTSNGVSKRRGKRKEVFQHVAPQVGDKPGKPEWYVPPPLRPWDPEGYELPKRKNPFKPEIHSDLGWVLARLREPDYGHAQYGWAVAQIHNQYTSTYLVLSGPHQTKVKVVREYDRMAYSPENISKIRERIRAKKNGLKDKLYEQVMVDSKTISKLSSLFAFELAAGGEVWVPE